MTQCHVSCAISSFIITCVSFATSPSHFHLHGICCSHTCTCGLITCVSHINTISPPKLSLNYQNQTRTFQEVRFLTAQLASALTWLHAQIESPLPTPCFSPTSIAAPSYARVVGCEQACHRRTAELGCACATAALPSRMADASKTR